MGVTRIWAVDTLLARSYPLFVPTLGDLRLDHNAVHDRLRDGALADGGRASATYETESKIKSTTNFPPGWDEERVRRLLLHYETRSEDEEVAEDEAALDDSTQTVMQITKELVPSVRALLSEHTG